MLSDITSTMRSSLYHVFLQLFMALIFTSLSKQRYLYSFSPWNLEQICVLYARYYDMYPAVYEPMNLIFQWMQKLFEDSFFNQIHF